MSYASAALNLLSLSKFFFIVLSNKVFKIWNSKDELVLIRGRSKTRGRGLGLAHKTQRT